jgi:hypothetical protein
LLFSVCTGDVELDLLGGAVELDVELVDFDVGVARCAGAVAVCLEDVIGQDAQRRRGEEQEGRKHGRVCVVGSHCWQRSPGGDRLLVVVVDMGVVDGRCGKGVGKEVGKRAVMRRCWCGGGCVGVGVGVGLGRASVVQVETDRGGMQREKTK